MVVFCKKGRLNCKSPLSSLTNRRRYAMGVVALDLDKAVGFSGAASQPLHATQDYILYASGALVVKETLPDHAQTLLQGHDQAVNCLALSPSANYFASGHSGTNSDVIVWDANENKQIFRLQEHDYGVAHVAFEAEERFLFTIGVVTDAKFVVWDLQTGCIVANISYVAKLDTTRPKPIDCACWGGRRKDIKRRDTATFQLATGGEGALKLWTFDPATGMLTFDICTTGVSRNFTAVCFSNDREYLYAGSTSGDFMVVHTKQRVMHSVTTACSGPVRVLATLPGSVQDQRDRLIVGGGDGTVGVFIGDSRAFQLLACIGVEGGVSALNPMSISEDGSLNILSGTNLGKIFELRMSTRGSTATLLREHHGAAVRAVCYSKDNSETFVTACEDGGIRMWDANSYGVVSFGFCQTPICLMPSSVCFSNDVIFTGWGDGKIRAHDAEDGKLLWAIDNAHQSGVTSLALSHNISFICSGGECGEVRVWELKTRQMIYNLKQHTMAVTSLQIADDDEHVFSASRDRSIMCWNLMQGVRTRTLAQKMGGVNSIALHPDGKRLLSVGQERKITFWDVREAESLQSISLPGEQFAIALSADGKLFATAGTDLLVRLWDFSSGELIAEGEGHSATVRSLAFSPDGRQMVSVGDDCSMVTWNLFYLDDEPTANEPPEAREDGA